MEVKVGFRFVGMRDKISDERAAIKVTSKTSGKKIVCVRAMSCNDRGAGTSTIGGLRAKISSC